MIQGAPLLLSLLLAVAAMAGTLAFTLPFGAESFPSIQLACSANGLAPGACLTGARAAGLASLMAYGLVLVIGVRRKWFTMATGSPYADLTASQALFVAGALALFCAHAGILVFGPAFVSRLNETEAYSTLVSLENLLLPLLLQLYVSAGRAGAGRPVLLAALLIGMALSPYRAMIMALYLFGLLLPLALQAWDLWRSGGEGRRWRGLGGEAAMALVVGLCLMTAGAVDTRMRSPTLLAQAEGLAELPPERPVPRIAPPRASADGGGAAAADAMAEAQSAPAEMPLPPADLGRRLAQRVVFPLFQAAIAGHLAEAGGQLPTLQDQLLRKLRLSEAPNLEEFLFRRIYGGATHGETTSLTYGEARVYFPGPALPWMIAVPLMVLAGWRLLARRGLDCGALFGLALWRSSFSGLFPILPALLLQGAGLWAIDRFPLRRWERSARLALALVLLAALGQQSWTMATALSGRKDVLYARYELEQGCWLQSPSWVPVLVDRVGNSRGLPMHAVLAAHHRTAMVLALPYGEMARPLLEEEAAAIARLSHCRADPAAEAPSGAVRLLDARLVSRGFNPLEALIVAALTLALARLVRPWLGRGRP